MKISSRCSSYHLLYQMHAQKHATIATTVGEKDYRDKLEIIVIKVEYALCKNSIKT